MITHVFKIKIYPLPASRLFHESMTVIFAASHLLHKQSISNPSYLYLASHSSSYSGLSFVSTSSSVIRSPPILFLLAPFTSILYILLARLLSLFLFTGRNHFMIPGSPHPNLSVSGTFCFIVRTITSILRVRVNPSLSTSTLSS